MGSALPAVRAGLRRLKKRGDIAVPYRGFHVIVPPEYRRLGCLPAEQFVPQLLAHLDELYYAGLLSAAEYHGAAHHRPQVFQVIVEKNRPTIACGQVRVQFVAKKKVRPVPTELRNTPRGEVRISTAEATALDLVGYPEHAGGLDNVATVLAELAEKLDGERLVRAAGAAPVAWAQRLGHLLELVAATELAGPLRQFVGEHATVPVPLLASARRKGAPRDVRWKLIINSQVEPEL